MVDVPEPLREKAMEILAEIAESYEDDEDGESCNVRFEQQDSGIWFHGDENIDLAQAAEMTQALLDQLGLDDGVVISWAETCSKPGVGEFGGGAVAVRRGHEPKWFNPEAQAREWLRGALPPNDERFQGPA